MADHAAAAVSRGTERGPFTPLTPTQTQGCGNIDAILGGVSQVLYTHSNQRVVGGSKAEERISRAAMRDVFENKMFSQFPANHLVGTQESEEEDVPETSGPPALPPATGEEVRAGAGGERPLHPVTFDLQAVHRGREETFILGQTPQAIRRQQLEQMASGLGFSSPRVFAEEVLRCASAQRLTWLRRYYSSLDRPDLDDLVSKNFPDPAAPTALPCPPAPETPRRRRGRTKGSQKDRGGGAPPSKPQSPRIPRGAVRRGRQNVGKSGRTRRASASAASPPRAAGGPGSDQEVGSGLEFSGEDPPAAPPHPAGRDRPSPPASPAARLQGVCLEPSAGAADRTAPPRPGPPPRCEPPSPSPASLLNDLLGDTSILDDLLRPPASARQRLLPTATPSPTLRLHGDSSRDAAAHSASPPPPPPRRKAATGCKDFWDILNEGSEESLERLADLSVLERVRLKTDPAAPTSSGGGEASALWKTNRKFLWRK